MKRLTTDRTINPSEWIEAVPEQSLKERSEAHEWRLSALELKVKRLREVLEAEIDFPGRGKK